ncbi:MAG: tetrathionate reductase subunit TtrA [Tetragenococcus koreensis]|nr:tetrathionate reductase subunit TtrA [Tetragenococcus koreensis]
MLREINVNSEIVAWLPWSVQYFFFIGIAAIALLIAVGYRWFLLSSDPEKESKMDVEMAAVSVAFVGGIVGPLSLMSELHQPGRFLNFYLHFASSSWMAIGSLIIPVISGIVVAYFLLLIRSKTKKEDLPKLIKGLHWGKFDAKVLLKPIRVIALLTGIAVFIYSGNEVYTVKARTMWHTLAFPILMFLTALVGIFPFLQLMLFKETNKLSRLAKMQVISIGLLLLTTIIWLFSGTPSSHGLLVLMQRNDRWIILNVILGLLFIATTAFAFVHVNRRFSLKAIIAQAASALTLMWFIRWVWLMEVQLLPKFNSTLNAYDIPLGHYGVFSILTSIGVFIILTLLVFVLLNITGIYTPESSMAKSFASKPSDDVDRDSSEERRKWILKGSMATVGLFALGAGFYDATKRVVQTIATGTSGKKTKDRIHGNSLETEGAVVNNKWKSNPNQIVAFTQCYGCWTQCGVRARVDVKEDKILRVDGNPYNPLSHSEHFSYDTSISDAFLNLYGKNGIDKRSTSCSRGAVTHEGVKNKTRILKPMKRVGPRGSGQWKSISFEDLVDEIVNGGDLFGEGHVEGLKDIYDPSTPLDAKHPSYGPKSNQLLTSFSGPEGRTPLMKRFALKSFGTINFGAHGSYCGLNMRSGSGALMNDLAKNTHVKPDWDYVEYAVFWGTSPAQAGNPFKRQGRQLADERSQRDNFEYAVIDPNMPNTTTLATKDHEWFPINPGTDIALAMGMIRYIIENDRYNESYLKQPNAKAAEEAGELNYTNSTHLVIMTKDHPQYGQFLKEKDISGVDGQDSNFVLNKNQELVSAEKATDAELFGDKTVTLKSGEEVQVKTSLSTLLESAQRYSLKEYSDISGISEKKIVELAFRFTAHGRRVAVITHGGMMSAGGFYSAWGILMLNALVGNLNHKGGVSVSGGKFPDFGGGPRYNLQKFPNSAKPSGLSIARSKKVYEESEEYQLLKSEGKNPYPAKAPWYPFAGGQLTEQVASAASGYPYKIKAWINCMANPVYGIAGMRNVLVDKLKDPENIPLFVSIDAFMNETTALADYIVPDTHNFESWGFTSPWAGVPVKASTARWPIVEPKVDKTKDGQPISLESFLVGISNGLSLPGFGEKAIPDSDGVLHPLMKAEDYYLRAAANIAFAGKAVPEANDEDVTLTGVSRIMPQIETTLKPDEQKRVAYIYSRGGRFNSFETGWKGEKTGPQWEKPLQIWNETVGKNRNAMSGEYYHGCPTYYPALFADGSTVESYYPKKDWPMKLISFKSNIMSSSTIHLERLRSIRRSNIIAINPKDAANFDIKHGERVKIKTPAKYVEANIALLDGVARGVIAIEHGWGHKGFGATEQILDGEVIMHDAKAGNGVNLNDLGIGDPTRKEVESTWLDWATGSSVRQGIPATLEKV